MRRSTTNHGHSPDHTTAAAADLQQLGDELVEMAFRLERQGRLDAADVALQVSLRVRDAAAGLQSARPPVGSDY